MNDWDRDNLEFFLTVDSNTFRAWYTQATPADKDYASNLLSQFSEELDVRMSMTEDHVDDLSTAQAALQKFRLNA